MSICPRTKVTAPNVALDFSDFDLKSYIKSLRESTKNRKFQKWVRQIYVFTELFPCWFWAKKTKIHLSPKINSQASNNNFHTQIHRILGQNPYFWKSGVTFWAVTFVLGQTLIRAFFKLGFEQKVCQKKFEKINVWKNLFDLKSEHIIDFPTFSKIVIWSMFKYM